MTKKRYPPDDGEPELKARLPDGDTVTVEALASSHELIDQIQPKYQVLPNSFLKYAIGVEYANLKPEEIEKAVKFGIRPSKIPAHALAGYACAICGTWIPSDQLTRRINLLKNTGDPEFIKLGFLAERIIYRRDDFDKEFPRVIPNLIEARVLKYALDFTLSVKEVIEDESLRVLKATSGRLEKLIEFLEETEEIDNEV